MKKMFSILVLVSCIFTVSNASSKDEKITSSKKIITVKKCKKYLGEANYKFINEIFNNKDAALSKCEKELLTNSIKS